ncbi:membrane protein [Mycobacterium phage Journey13]|nr:membrane protein [Mycobacterium phage Journey13]
MTNPYRPGVDEPAWHAGQPYGQPVAPPPMPAAVLPVKTNHAMHLVLSLITCGMWLPVWIVVAMVNSSRTRRVY